MSFCFLFSICFFNRISYTITISNRILIKTHSLFFMANVSFQMMNEKKKKQFHRMSEFFSINFLLTCVVEQINLWLHLAKQFRLTKEEWQRKKKHEKKTLKNLWINEQQSAPLACGEHAYITGTYGLHAGAE